VRVSGWWYVLESGIWTGTLWSQNWAAVVCQLAAQIKLILNDSFKMASFSPLATTVHIIPKWHYHACFVYMCYPITLTSVPLFLPQLPVDPPQVILHAASSAGLAIASSAPCWCSHWAEPPPPVDGFSDELFSQILSDYCNSESMKHTHRIQELCVRLN